MIDWDAEPPLFCNPLLTLVQLDAVAELQREVTYWRDKYDDLLWRARVYTQDKTLV